MWSATCWPERLRFASSEERYGSYDRLVLLRTILLIKTNYFGQKLIFHNLLMFREFSRLVRLELREDALDSGGRAS